MPYGGMWFLAGIFHRYGEGYRFAKLACDLVEKHGFIASQAKVYASMGISCHLDAADRRPRSISCGTAFAPRLRRVIRPSLASVCSHRSHTFSCGTIHSTWCGANRRWRWTSPEKPSIGDAADIIVSQQRFIATMQGRTATFSTFSDAQFDEATFEAQLTTGRMPLVICWYWIVKLKARFLSGDYAEALAAADKAKPLLEASLSAKSQHLDYFYYTALTVSALYETASADEQQAWRELLTAHREQLREWAENNPPTFADKHALVLAEIARLEKRDADALRLYEQAIHLARENGFVQNEGLAHELAAQYYLARGLETAGYAYLRNARNCYDRWGAHGKVKQLDERYPRLREERTPAASATIGPPVGAVGRRDRSESIAGNFE